MTDRSIISSGGFPRHRARRTLVIGLIGWLIAESLTAAGITGRVQSQLLRENIPGALIILHYKHQRGEPRTTVSDQQGFFMLSDVPAGLYNLEVAAKGYYKNMLFDLDIEARQNIQLQIKLLERQGEEGDDYCFMLGGIEVCSVQRELIPETPVTTRRIDSGEIEHMQASSLGDILALVPGVEKSKNPGLSDPTQVGLRSVSMRGASPDALASFGSAVIVNGNPVGNDANLTTQLYGSSGYQGIDLRTIPAENIKSVEVITGIPSVEYGNFANGLIRVETKTGFVAPKLKVKLNPDTKTASFSHGFRLLSGIMDYHLNYGFSERNLRKVGDEYHRLHFSSAYNRKLLSEQLELTLRGGYTHMIDDEKPTDIYKKKEYNRGYLATGSVNWEYKSSGRTTWDGLLSADLNRKKAHKEKWVGEQIVVDSVIYAGYFGKLDEIGREWKIYSKIRRVSRIARPAADHQLMTGLECNLQKNTGRGYQLDPVWNYYGFYSGRRSYTYDEFPEVAQWSLFGEDMVKGHWWGKKMHLMFGLRYDVFTPRGINWGRMIADRAFLKSAQGDFLSPRFNWQLFISDDLRLRLGAGRNAKAVSLAYIYKPPTYYKFLNDDGILVEEMHLQYNPKLQTYTTDKYELSIDWRLLRSWGASLTGYFSRSDNQPVGVGYPWGYSINPDTLTDASYSINQNRGWDRSSGVELTLKSKRIWNFQYTMNVTYRFNKSGQNGREYDSSPDTSWEEIWYPPAWRWREKVIIDYQLNYISNRLGIWVTLEAQQIPYEKNEEVYRSNKTTKRVDGFDYELPFHQGMLYWYDGSVYSSGGRWLMNFRLTKAMSRKTEFSLYINNVLDNRGRWSNPFTNLSSDNNPPIYYGLEVSAQW